MLESCSTKKGNNILKKRGHRGPRVASGRLSMQR